MISTVRGFLGALLALAAVSRGTPAGDPEPPRLTVILVVDQMRADYLERFAHVFGPGGFRRLLAEGAQLARCEYPYARTETGPGHATIATGRLPSVHGIVANEWFDASLGRHVYCVEDRDARRVGPKGDLDGVGRSARHLAAETLGDRLRAASLASKVFSVSWKDRSAILLGGKRASGCWWFDVDAGTFASSRAWPAPIPPWLAPFHESRSLSRLPASWDRSCPPDAYARCSPDESPWEHSHAKLGRTFPHPIRSWSAAACTPVALRLVTDLAIEILERESLGADAAADLLCVSWSATDYAGHAYGPSSHEVLDVFASLDGELARLLAKLDAAADRGRYAVALTSDHGATECAEASGGRGRRLLADVVDRLEASISKATGKTPGEGRQWLLSLSACDAALDRDTLRLAGVDLPRAAAALRDALRAEEAVEAAYVREEIDGGAPPAGDPLVPRLRASSFPGRSADVIFVRRPGWIAFGDAADHGSPHPSDRHVPMLVAGPGVRAARIETPVTPADLAPTLAAWLGLPIDESEAARLLPIGISREAAASSPAR